MTTEMWTKSVLSSGSSVFDEEVDRWFMDAVLPQEPALMRFLRRHWRGAETEMMDLRQEVYIRVYLTARKGRPFPNKHFLFLVARNLIIDNLRKKNVVLIETMANIEELNVLDRHPTPEDCAASRQELRLFQKGLNKLPGRYREVVMLRKVNGLSQRETAMAMGVTEDMVEHLIAKGMKLLTQAVRGSRGPIMAGAKRYMALKGKYKDDRR